MFFAHSYGFFLLFIGCFTFWLNACSIRTILWINTPLSLLVCVLCAPLIGYYIHNSVWISYFLPYVLFTFFVICVRFNAFIVLQLHIWYQLAQKVLLEWFCHLLLAFRINWTAICAQIRSDTNFVVFIREKIKCYSPNVMHRIIFHFN